MSVNSPFSRYYRDFIEDQEEKKQLQSAPRPAIQQLPTQTTNNHPDINIFEALLQKERKIERPKTEQKIKVFGVGLRKSRKEEQKSDFLKKAHEEFKNQAQISHNLLESLQSLPEHYYQKHEQTEMQSGSPEQLRKLLQLQSGPPEQQEKQKITEDEKKGIEIVNPLKLTDSEDIELKIPQKSSQIQLLLNKLPIKDKNEQNTNAKVIRTTESQEIIPPVVMGENKSISGRSMNSSKIRSIFDHCSELFSHNFGVPESHIQEVNPITNQIEESQIITGRESRNSKANSDSPVSPNYHLKVQNIPNYKLSAVSGQQMNSSKSPKSPRTSQRVQVPITRKYAKPPLIQTKNTRDQKRSKVLIQQEQDSLNHKGGIGLKKYLSLDSHYNYEIDKLINRYQKVSALEEKKRQIKEELHKLVPKKKEETSTNRYDKHYYMPVHKFPSHQQNIDYFYEGPQSHKQSALFASAPPTKRSQQVNKVDFDKTSPPCQYQSDLQKELNKNVQKMEKIINKFKFLSNQISYQSQDYVNSQYAQESISNLRQGDRNIENRQPSQYSEVQSNAYEKELNKHFFSTTESPKDIKQISSKFEIQNPGFDSAIDSVQQISLSKELARATQRNNTNFRNAKPCQTGKQTSRTEKTGMTRRQHPSAQQSHNTHHCYDNHQYFTEQISKLNSKIRKLEQRERSQLKKVKSQEQMKNRATLGKGSSAIKLDQNSIESDYEEDIDQSIPVLETVRYEDLYKKEKKTKKSSLEKKKSNTQSPSKDNPVRGILKERRGVNIDDKVLKKMKVKFPIIEQCPSRQDSLASLVSLGQYTLSILLKFVKNRIHVDLRKVKIEGKLKIKKFIDFIHYSLPHFDYHLIFYFSGKMYFGHWHQQLVNGEGYKHGFGYYMKPNKYFYQGQFQLNKKHGKGLLNTTKGQIYDGDWKKGKKCGFGVLINQTGDIYQGFFQGGKKCGTGEEQLANGDYYRGQFKKGKLNGAGFYIWVDGSIYKGQFKNGLLNGHGIWRSKDDDCYEGQYKDNKKHGKGTYTWSNGQCFTGQFYEDQNIVQRPSFSQLSKKQSLNSPRARKSEEMKSARKSKDRRK